MARILPSIEAVGRVARPFPLFARHALAESPYRSPPGFRIIGAFKLVGALLLLGAGVGVYRLFGRDVGDVLEHLAATFRLDPRNHYIDLAISKVADIEPARLRQIGVGTILYAILYGAEGVGLVLGKRWGGYLTVVATGSLVPLEVFEVYRKASAVRIGVLAINVAIVIYLVVKLIQERRAGARS